MQERTEPTGGRPMARLALADGSLWRGQAFGATGQGLCVEAEVVFNTALTGYQESLTDPSYKGQVLVQTTPMIGNTGANARDDESDRVQVSGFVVCELTRRHSNYRATGTLGELLAKAGVLGIAGVDTRALTRRLRSGGVMGGCLTDDASLSDAEVVAKAQAAAGTEGANLAALAACTSETTWTEDLGGWGARRREGKSVRVLALDCGGKRTIYRQLADRGCEVVVSPPGLEAAEISRLFREGEIQGLFISNGPGDPAAVEETIATLKAVLEDEGSAPMPVFGICLGHQLLACAAGGKTYKLKFGHRGANQPVSEVASGRVAITSQNHGFAVEAGSLDPERCRVTHTHLNDGTVAGFEFIGREVFGVQFHPEASPGPHDASVLFDRFVAAARQAGGTSGS